MSCIRASASAGTSVSRHGTATGVRPVVVSPGSPGAARWANDRLTSAHACSTSFAAKLVPGRGAPPQRLRTACAYQYETKEHETPEQAQERRLRESAEVIDKIHHITNEAEFNEALAKAGDKLVVLEIESEEVCETGYDEVAQEHWKLDAQRAAELQKQKCSQIKHVFQRTARSCADTVFLALEVDGEECGALCDKLNVQYLPTVQFYRHGKLLWQAAGTQNMQDGAALADGVLYYSNEMGGGANAADYVQQVSNREQLDAFIKGGDDKQLTVLNVSVTDGVGCIKVYPAVVAVAKSFAGYATFGRMLGDVSNETRQLMRELNILEVPTFIFYRGGKEVGRHVGSSRGDLIGQILQVQAAYGVAPPPPPTNMKRRITRRTGR